MKMYCSEKLWFRKMFAWKDLVGDKNGPAAAAGGGAGQNIAIFVSITRRIPDSPARTA
jgi:hypothetical protein